MIRLVCLVTVPWASGCAPSLTVKMEEMETEGSPVHVLSCYNRCFAAVGKVYSPCPLFHARPCRFSIVSVTRNPGYGSIGTAEEEQRWAAAQTSGCRSFLSLSQQETATLITAALLRATPLSFDVGKINSFLSNKFQNKSNYSGCSRKTSKARRNDVIDSIDVDLG